MTTRIQFLPNVAFARRVKYQYMLHVSFTRPTQILTYDKINESACKSENVTVVELPGESNVRQRDVMGRSVSRDQEAFYRLLD
jgi:hypothetical protein